ncbi:hypothetical protein ATANTOWER_018988 [Ataeniobius toweri]|uniref:Uncharacterized protein n=1 Tax=Ataeniobius toweri TaxID=208326 RepID=A0ABU7CHY1_9TELE|nr:hypothetical protein [Ataeniobius toweri]
MSYSLCQNTPEPETRSDKSIVRDDLWCHVTCCCWSTVKAAIYQDIFGLKLLHTSGSQGLLFLCFLKDFAMSSSTTYSIVGRGEASAYLQQSMGKRRGTT